MSDTSPKLSLPLVAAEQAQKHVTVNEALTSLDALVHLSVIDADLTSPPGSPAEGDRYIVASPATGDWAGEENAVAVHDSGAWVFHQAQKGWRAWVEDEGYDVIHDGSAWLAATAYSTNAATIGFQVVEEELSLSGATTDSTVTIPDRAIVFGVSTRTTEAVTGATSYECGVVADTGKFGSLLGSAPNSTNSGVVGPTAYYAATPVRLTANGGNFTGGKVRIAIHFLFCGVPGS